jgi:hypothetical protein
MLFPTQVPASSDSKWLPSNMAAAASQLQYLVWFLNNVEVGVLSGVLFTSTVPI